MKITRFQLFFFVIATLLLHSCKRQDPGTSKIMLQQAIPKGEIVSTLDDEIWYIHQDKKGNFWFGSNGRGVYCFDGKYLKRYTTSDGIIDNSIRGIHSDKTGNIFIETPEGVSKYNGHEFTTLPVEKGEFLDWQLGTDDLWFNCNTNAKDIYRYDGKKLIQLSLPRKNLQTAFDGEVTGLSFNSMSNSPYAVFGIDKDRAGNLWIGTAVAGAFRYDGKAFLWIPEKELSTLPDGRVPAVRSMIEDGSGYFWLSNFISKYKIINTNDATRYEKLQGMDSSFIIENDLFPYFNSGLTDKNGNLWMCTYSEGVWKFDGKKWTHFKVTHGNIDALLISIYQDRMDDLWLGTNNLGVFKFDGTAFNKVENFGN